MSDHVKLLWDARIWFEVAKTFEAQAARIAELEAALQKIADRTRNAHLLSYAGHMELYQVSDFINDALAGGEDEYSRRGR